MAYFKILTSTAADLFCLYCHFLMRYLLLDEIEEGKVYSSTRVKNKNETDHSFLIIVFPFLYMQFTYSHFVHYTLKFRKYSCNHHFHIGNIVIINNNIIIIIVIIHFMHHFDVHALSNIQKRRHLKIIRSTNMC